MTIPTGKRGLWAGLIWISLLYCTDCHFTNSQFCICETEDYSPTTKFSSAYEL